MTIAIDTQTIVSLYELFRTLFIFADVFLLAFFIFLVAKSWKYIPKYKLAKETELMTYSLSNVVLQERWDSIINRSKIRSAESVRGAVIDADNMVDELLTRMGIGAGKEILAPKESGGVTMADKLDYLSTEDFTSLNKLLGAHGIRNKIVHEPDFMPSPEEVSKALEGYGAFLKELGVINK